MNRQSEDGFQVHDILQADAYSGFKALYDLAKAVRYALNHWDAFALFLDDGRVAIDNNAAERAIKPVVNGRKNFLFAGSDAGGESLASAMTIVETAKFNGLDP